jgi:hypothetical protein
MPLLKYYDKTTSQWLPILAGAKGETGDTGATGATGPQGLPGTSIVNVTSPIVNTGTTSDAVIALDQGGLQPAQNLVLNSAFDIWQRGNSIGFGGTQYSADQWRVGRSGSTGDALIERTATTPANFSDAAQVRRNSGASSSGTIQLTQVFENLGTRLAGKTIRLSFYAMRGTNYSASGNSLVFGINTTSATPTTASYATGGLFLSSNPNTETRSTTVALTTSYVRYSASFDVPSTANAFQIFFSFTPTGTSGTNDFYRITGVQLEDGPQLTQYKRNGANTQAELDACSRYYVRYSYPNNAFIGIAVGHSTNQFAIPWFFPTEMRVNPSFQAISGGIFLYPNAGTFYNFSGGNAIAIDSKSALLTGSGPNITYPDNRASLAYALGTRTFAFSAEL